jgi:hypothetical protein
MKRVATMLAVANLCYVVVPGCRGAVPPGPTTRSREQAHVTTDGSHGGSITGTAHWYDDRQPAAGIYVSAIHLDPMALSPYVAVTDSSGRYTMSGLPPGEYAVSARREGPKMPGGQGRPGQDVFLQMVVPKKELRTLVRPDGNTVHDVVLWK